MKNTIKTTIKPGETKMLKPGRNKDFTIMLEYKNTLKQSHYGYAHPSGGDLQTAVYQAIEFIRSREPGTDWTAAKLYGEGLREFFPEEMKGDHIPTFSLDIWEVMSAAAQSAFDSRRVREWQLRHQALLQCKDSLEIAESHAHQAISYSDIITPLKKRLTAMLFNFQSLLEDTEKAIEQSKEVYQQGKDCDDEFVKEIAGEILQVIHEKQKDNLRKEQDKDNGGHTIET